MRSRHNLSRAREIGHRGVVALAFLWLAGCASAPEPQAASPFVWPSEGIIVADSTVGWRPREKRAPRYPAHERMNGGEAAFFAAFVLDTTGHAVMPTLRFLGNPPAAFASAVCAYYRDVSFAPARVAGKANPALVVVPFVFALGGGKWQNRSIDPNPVRERFKTEGATAAITEMKDLPSCPQD